MAQGVNLVILIGRLGGDPKIHVFNDGNRQAVLSVATSERWKDRQTGEPRERTEWHRVVLKRNHDVDYAENYCQKGSLVRINGQSRTRKYIQNGLKERITEVVVQSRGCAFVLLRDGRPTMMTGAADNAGEHSHGQTTLGQVPQSQDPNAPLDYGRAKGG